MIQLPQPKYAGGLSVEEALRERRSKRSYQDEPLLLSQLSQLLWAAQGINNEAGYRTAPSAGALYPLEIYVAAGSVQTLSQGLYKYLPEKHSLQKIKDGDLRSGLAGAALRQGSVAHGAVDIVISAVYERTTGKYGERGIRYVHMEAGHVAQNIYLQAVSLNLGTVTIGAFDDEAVRKLLQMPEGEVPLYVMPVGIVASRKAPGAME
jgi:SagB-type dehydrogenase family enzyme